MKIVHIIPGSGGSFYCGNCLRDSKYFNSLRKSGHDVLKVPMYLPLFQNDMVNGHVPVFYGAVNLYLKQAYPFFRNAPRWLDNMLNTRPVLRQAAKMAGSTRAVGLEDMTVSMLMGEHGNQSGELEELTKWLEVHFRPDIIHLSNALLLGLAGKLRERLGIPVVCTLQDEDVWVDVMSAANRERVWRLMGEKARDIDAFVSVSHYFSRLMTGNMKLDSGRLHTLHLGVDPDDYQFINSAGKERAVGFLSRMNRENGLDILVDAFIMLKGDSKNQDVKLYISGGSTGDDAAFIKTQKSRIIRAGISRDVIFLENFGNEHRHIFFERVSVLSVPVRRGEAFGIYLAEAMASGIPAVQPDLGAFPEIIEATGGGLIYGKNTPGELAGGLEKLLSDKDLLSVMSINARKGVEQKFNINTQAALLADIYKGLIQPEYVQP
jgi:glycosyltransferase involved in cell wall biosynthesis